MSKVVQPDAGALAGASVPETLREVVEGRFVFRASLPISDCSRYGDGRWTWYGSSNPRLNRYHESELTIDWEELRNSLGMSSEIVEDLKKYAFLRYTLSKVVFPHTQKNAHPVSITGEVTTLANFLSHIIHCVLEDTLIRIESLSEIEVDDLKEALSTYPKKATDRLRNSLRHLASESLSKHLSCGRLLWNEYDIETIEWNVKEREHYQRLPEEAFRLLSNSATADVKQFLTAIGIEPQDTTEIGRGENLYLSSFPNFGKLFNKYADLRVAVKEKRDGAVSQYTVWAQSMKGVAGRLSRLVERARMAAHVIVTAYTGARISELGSFRRGCLRRRGDLWVLGGTLVKGQDINAPADKDEWVAIPIVRDAVTVLEEVGRPAGATYLFHGSRVHGGTQSPMSSVHLSRRRLTPYLRLVDREKKWKHLRPHAHQFRNSIVFEMRRAGLGIPFITFQLKHLFNELENKINNTTLLYGGISSEAAQRLIEEANLEYLRAIYHPDSPVAGGGAEEHKRRRAAYFQATVVPGVQVDAVLRQLAREGMMPMTDVGLAYCGGKTKIDVGGVKEDPPCIGSLACNPVRCKNAIITLQKLPLWQRSRAVNRERSQDPAFGYAKPVFVAAAEEADGVCKVFEGVGEDAVVRFLEKKKRRKGGE